MRLLRHDSTSPLRQKARKQAASRPLFHFYPQFHPNFKFRSLSGSNPFCDTPLGFPLVPDRPKRVNLIAAILLNCFLDGVIGVKFRKVA